MNSGYANLNAHGLLRQFSNLEYNKLRNAFADGIKQSLQILKDQTLKNLAGTGININSPFRKKNGKAGYTTYSPLKDGVALEVSNAGDAGRVRIATAGRQGKQGYYTTMQWSHFALMWFEFGTKDRYKETGKSYQWKSNSNKKQGGARKHKVVEKKIWTGKINPSPFFNPAIQQTMGKVQSSLENNIKDAIDKAFNK